MTTTKDSVASDTNDNDASAVEGILVYSDLVPHPASHLMAQSDASGMQKKIEAPVYDDDVEHNRGTASSLKDEEEVGFWKLVLCCFTRDTRFRKSTLPVYSERPPSRGLNSPVGKHFNPPSPKARSIMTPQTGSSAGKKCLVLDLDETLVHSSFQAIPNSDYIIPVCIDNTYHNVYVLKRPGVDEFMRRIAKDYEVVIFTASLSKYADPLLDKLDIHKVINKRLFRESCVFHQGHYVKDLSMLSRELSSTIIVDNSPISYCFHPENAIGCSSYIDDKTDKEMWQIADFLEAIKNCDDVREHCRHWREWCKKHSNSANNHNNSKRLLDL
mmetsp:Transcript_40929/g.41801  ORF Transcript_40929/g.41801 Transcript_40929/m.41801 type:complete len:328 (+) Transcript_40929:240-1223(+)|eukprot:CAMPEP_0182422552 /NCGR_PEP_ID=MMETSP1167-20130531/8286_1 /TAXON_ID=2988 /ORGANISM="Mallomonas Sp, Strain CCMP3275" /LENGTH=327 /DNA_ID=CAMNT_0024600717 /DNA_START=209 /DNA_END=1192 /DNA_ORIENTATION=+